MRRITSFFEKVLSGDEKYAPLEEGKAGEIRRYRAHDRTKIYNCSWSSDSRFIVSVGQNGTLELFDTMKEVRGPVHKFRLMSGWQMATAFSPDRKYVSVGGLTNICTVYKVPESIFDAKALEEKSCPVTETAYAELIGHDKYIASCDFVDEKRILTTSGDSTAKLWDLESKKEIKSYTAATADVMSASAKLDNGTLVIGSCDAKVRVLDAQSGAEKAVFSGTADINSVKLFAGGSLVVAGSDDSKVYVLDVGTGTSRHIFSHDSGVTSVDASPTGRYVTAASENGLIRIWDLTDGSIVQEIRTPARISALRVAPGGGHFATAGWDGYLRIWRFPFP